MSSPLEPRPERSSTTYRDLQHGNVAKSVLLLTAMTVLLVGLVVAGGTYLGAGAPAIAVVAALVTVVSTFGSWYASDRLVIAMTKAREVTPEEYPRLHFLVENLAIAAEHCGMCHTPKNFVGADENGQVFQGYPLQGWYAPNLTGDKRPEIIAGAERNANEVRWWRNGGLRK